MVSLDQPWPHAVLTGTGRTVMVQHWSCHLAAIYMVLVVIRLLLG